VKVVHSRVEFSSARLAVAGPVGFVPTMGALHAGHAALLDAARAANTAVVASIFVNPMQFGPNEDLARYPRTLDADLEICERAGADLVWAPDVTDVYPYGLPLTSVDPGSLGTELEGVVRPGHFAGVLTVVAKLLNLVRPDRAYFGEKDYQQLTLIRQLVRDLNFEVKVVPVATVREADGLAMSSRNRYLDSVQRELATTLSAALAAGRHAAGLGPDAVLSAARAVLDTAADIEVDYLELRAANLGPLVLPDAATLVARAQEAPQDVESGGETPWSSNARLLVAARVGSTRLIDNMPLTVGVSMDGHPATPESASAR
jgi:pantoate--beta-alanine ligase